MTQVSIIGLDLAKNVFQVHGSAANGEALFNRKLRRAEAALFREDTALPGRHGGLRRIALLGPEDQGFGP